MNKITNERMNELIIKEKKLDLLEAGGVESWDDYYFVLKDFFRDQEKVSRRENLLDALEETFFNQATYEPGIGTTFGKEAHQACLLILQEHKVGFEDLDR